MYEHFWNSIWNPYTFPGAEKTVLLLLIAVAAVTALAALFGGRKAAFKAASFSLLVFWIFTIAAGTLLGRKEMYEPKVKMELFWTFCYAWEKKSGLHWFYLIGNIAVFVPLGLLLPTSFKFCRRWYVTVLLGALLSLGIESAQYIWKLGLMEMDDIFHNTWGTVLGYCLFCWGYTVRYGQWRRVSRWLCSLLVLAASVGGIGYLVWLNQPNWNGIW